MRLPALWHCVVTHKPKGDLTIQFLQDFNAPTPWYFAIIGGTGDYQGAHGQVTYVSDTDNIGRCYSSEAIVLASHGVQQRGGAAGHA